MLLCSWPDFLCFQSGNRGVVGSWQRHWGFESAKEEAGETHRSRCHDAGEHTVFVAVAAWEMVVEDPLSLGDQEHPALAVVEIDVRPLNWEHRFVQIAVVLNMNWGMLGHCTIVRLQIGGASDLATGLSAPFHQHFHDASARGEGMGHGDDSAGAVVQSAGYPFSQMAIRWSRLDDQSRQRERYSLVEENSRFRCGETKQ